MNRKKQLHMIGNAHIDPVWLWSWQEGYAEIKATFRSALDRMEEFPEFVFTCACAAYYKWVEENEPSLFEEIRKRVTEGRWVLTGGWWIQPDCNIPSGESFARQALYSQRYFHDRFGKMSKVGYNVDSFGHNAMLPQLLKKSRMDSYVMLRPGDHEMELPANLFHWESPDGSRVHAFRIHINYASWWGDPDPLFEKTEEVLKLAEAQGTDFMNFYGVGNHGGGPTIKNIKTIQQLQKDHPEMDILFSSPEAFFDHVRRTEHEHAEHEHTERELPVVRGELQHHASGCYSSHSETKANNRKAEHRVLTAEKFAVLAHGLLGSAYPYEKLFSSWEKLLFNQFHDVLGGCSVKAVYRDVAEFYGKSLTDSAEAMNDAMQKISWSIDTMGDEEFKLSRDQDWTLWEMTDSGAPIIVFNPLSWPVTQPVVLNRLLKGVRDDEGNVLPFQKARAGRIQAADKWDTLFLAEIPAMGYRTYWAHTTKDLAFEAPQNAPACAENTLENEFVKLVIDPATGTITSLLDKKLGREVLSGPGAVPLVIDEEGLDTWGHNRYSHREMVLKYDKVVGAFGNASVSVVENGPLRAWLRARSSYGRSELVQDFILYAGKPEVEVAVKLDWRERQKMLKLSFPVDAVQPVATYEIPYGFINRPADGEEEPGQQWFDLSGGTCGLSILNDGKYGCCCVENDMRLTLVRSPIFSEYEGERDELCEFMDQGIQEFKYMLLPHGDDFCFSAATRKAYELNVPAVRINETYHRGPLPRRLEGISISSEHVIASALKRAENGEGYVLRCSETSGTSAHTVIGLPVSGRTWETDFGPFEIKTFLIPDDKGVDIAETDLLEMQ